MCRFRDFLITCLVGLISAPVLAAEVLRVLAWPGYADPDIIQAFEKKTGARVEITFVDTDEVLWTRLTANEGRDFDVFALNIAELARFIDRGISVPLDPTLIPNLSRQQPRFRDPHAIPGLTRFRQLYAVPYAFAEMGLIYNRALVDEPPTSLAAMWDPRYQGKVLAYDGSSHNFSLAAMLLGLANPFGLNDEQFVLATERLVALRRNVLTFYTLPEDATRLFLENPVALVFANYGMQQVKALQDAGADVGYVIPQEGALAWLDCWALARDARSPALAHAWIDFMLGPQASEALATRHGLGTTTLPSDLDDSARLLWLEPVQDNERRARLWNAIRSGDPSPAQ